MNLFYERIAAVLLLPLIVPPFALKFILRILTGERIFYSSVRLGKDRKPFRIYKFSTFKAWSFEEFNCYLHKNPDQFKEWQTVGKLRNDPRISFLGSFFRRSSIDELPQLINIIRGEMSFIGPRPITRAEDVYYGKYSKLLHSVKPGMTGLWQVSGRNLNTYSRRVAMNIYYIKNHSFKLDAWIAWRTIIAVLSRRGAY